MITFNASKIIHDKIKGMKLGCLKAEGISIQSADSDFEDSLDELQRFLEKKFSEKRPAEDSVVSAVRRMYRRIGWEPTRYRPSSEALIRRILQGKSLYRINNLVDYGNLASAYAHLPMGLYDTAKIKGNITIDVGGEDEAYEGISKSLIHATGKLILRDEQGIFGNPTADSLRTSIKKQTNEILAVFFCPPEVEDGYIELTLKKLENFYLPFTGGTENLRSEIIPLD